MKKISKNPTSFACDVLSLLVPVFGIGGAVVYLLREPRSLGSWAASLLIVLGAFVAAAIVRILGIIGQILFDLSSRVADQKVVVEQINCDVKDLNESARQIKFFFDQIEKHLQLKK